MFRESGKAVGILVACFCLAFLPAVPAAALNQTTAPPPYWEQPLLGAVRTVQRVNNYYQIDLEIISYASSSVISNIEVTDTNRGVQCVPDPMVIWKGYPPCTVYSNDDQGLTGVIKITFPTPWTLEPEETMLLRYYAVPVMYPPDVESDVARVIGEQLKITYKVGDQQRVRELPHLAESYSADLPAALQSADYLLVTVPQLLYQHYTDADVDALLGQVGRLAKYKNGVLGYSGPLSFYQLRRLITFGGPWSSRLTPNWTSTGYLLLVGEDTIVPHRPTWTVNWGEDKSLDIELSDYFYMNISHPYCGDKQPDLRVGRIIGKTAADLAIPIQTSLEVLSGLGENDGSNALLVSGHEKIHDIFPLNVETARQYLETNKGVSAGCINTEYFTFQEKILHKAIIHVGSANGGAAPCSKYCNPRPCGHGYDCLNNYTREELAKWMLDISGGSYSLPIDDYEVWAACYDASDVENARRGLDKPYIFMPDGATANSLGRNAIQNNFPGKDLVIYDGHAGGGGWSCFNYADVPGADIRSEKTRPVVLSFGCSAGKYPGNSISCALLKNGAAVFTGATQMINTDDGRRHLREHGLLKHWYRGRAVGDIIFDWKNELSNNMAQSGLDRRLLYVYNFYGDPKFGASAAGVSRNSRSPESVRALDPPPSSIFVSVPDYVITKVEGYDEVNIPGGLIMSLEEKTPQVPYYLHTLQFPGEFRISDVQMVERGNTVTTTGLRLRFVEPDPPEPLNDPRETTPTLPVGAASQLHKITGIYPTKDFDWSVSYSEDGSVGTLKIFIYPFFYDPDSLRSTYYRGFQFHIAAFRTTIAIRQISSDRDTYSPGDKALFNLSLGNSGRTKDVLVESAVFDAMTGERVATLEDTQIPGLLDIFDAKIEVDTAELPAGDYTIQALVKDALGIVLDCIPLEFRVGTLKGAVQQFQVLPQHFEIGDLVEFSLEFINSGDSPLNGNCVFLITRGEEVVEEIVRPMTMLPPGETILFSGSWDSSVGEEGENYKVTGAVYYEGTASEPESDNFSTNLMPTAAFSFDPDVLTVGMPIQFDPSASTDPDGEIVRYEWDFDDGVLSEDGDTSHTWYQPGEYNVRLTVTDNEGGQDTMVQVVRHAPATARGWTGYR